MNKQTEQLSPNLWLDFDVTNILVDPESDLLEESHFCCYCNMIAVSPFQLTCWHYVCMRCIPKCKNLTVCPKPRCEDPDLEPPPHNLLKLTKMCIRRDKGLHAEIYCPFSPQGDDADGCREIITVISLREHLLKCQFAKVICPDCVLPIARYLLEEHRARSCRYRLQKCSKCDSWVRQKDMSDHCAQKHKYCVHCQVNFDEGNTVHSIVNCITCESVI